MIVFASLLDHLTPLISQYGYYGLFALLFVEDFGLPVPGETMLITAAVFAGADKLNIFLVGGVAVTAAFAGDNVGYGLGRYLGKEPLHRYGKYVLLTPEKIRWATGFFERYGVRVVLFARFVEGLRQLNGILAGVTGMQWKTFAICNLIGASVWVAVWTCVGYFGGSHIGTIERYGTLLAAIAGVAVLGFITFRALQSHRQAKVAKIR